MIPLHGVESGGIPPATLHTLADDGIKHIRERRQCRSRRVRDRPRERLMPQYHG